MMTFSLNLYFCLGFFGHVFNCKSGIWTNVKLSMVLFLGGLIVLTHLVVPPACYVILGTFGGVCSGIGRCIVGFICMCLVSLVGGFVVSDICTNVCLGMNAVIGRSVMCMISLNGHISASICSSISGVISCFIWLNMGHICRFVNMNRVVSSLVQCFVKMMCDITGNVVRDIMGYISLLCYVLLSSSGHIMSNILLKKFLLLSLFFPLCLDWEVSELSDEIMGMVLLFAMLHWSGLDPYFLFLSHVSWMVTTYISFNWMISTLVMSWISCFVGGDISLDWDVGAHIGFVLAHREVRGMLNNDGFSLVMCNVFARVSSDRLSSIFSCISSHIWSLIFGD
jgi:hypothetical protein